MSIVGAFDVHRRQLTFEYLDTVTGELKRGRVMPADRPHLRAWLSRFAGQADVQFALEGCTGWRYVVEELLAAGITPHLAEPADTAALRGKKRHAKTDKTDTRHLRVHLMAGDLPECWIPPEHVLEARATARLYKDLVDERGGWHQRVAARKELVTRLRAGRCEWCQQYAAVESHQVRKLADLTRPGRLQPAWAQRMARMRRKTLIVCVPCHQAIHAGTLTAVTA